ncbi:MAG: hypothetical protein R3C52_07570 [Hyphomonadaceae bacterium]
MRGPVEQSRLVLPVLRLGGFHRRRLGRCRLGDHQRTAAHQLLFEVAHAPLKIAVAPANAHQLVGFDIMPGGDQRGLRYTRLFQFGDLAFQEARSRLEIAVPPRKRFLFFFVGVAVLLVRSALQAGDLLTFRTQLRLKFGEPLAAARRNGAGGDAGRCRHPAAQSPTDQSAEKSRDRQQQEDLKDQPDHWTCSTLETVN